MKKIIFILLCCQISQAAIIDLTIKKSDGSTYWSEHFNDLPSCEKWLALEKTRPYWKQDFSGTCIDNSPPGPTPEEIAAAEKLKQDQIARKTILQNILSATPGTLTNAQRDTILQHLIKDRLGQ